MASASRVQVLESISLRMSTDNPSQTSQLCSPNGKLFKTVTN